MWHLIAKDMDLDDKVLHYVLLGLGGAVALLAKQGLETLAAKFWDTEFKQFKAWKKQQSRLVAKAERHPQMQ